MELLLSMQEIRKKKLISNFNSVFLVFFLLCFVHCKEDERNKKQNIFIIIKTLNDVDRRRQNSLTNIIYSQKGNKQNK